MGHISIQQLKHPVHIGQTQGERQKRQQLVFDLGFQVDAGFIAIEDNIERTVNYAAVCQAIMDYCDHTAYQLIETLAERLAKHLIEMFHLKNIKLMISKKPIDLPNIECVSISIERP